MIALLAALSLAGCMVQSSGPTATSDSPFFPHADDFKSGAIHGAAMREVGIATCQTCHAEGRAGARPCDSCHEEYPHPDDWGSGTVHGKDVLVQGFDLTRCTGCHQKEGLVATETWGCKTCHGAYPHDITWQIAGHHGVYALERGGPVAVCGSCHGEDLKGGDVGVSCTQCHAVFPHPDNWAEPSQHAAAWVAKREKCTGCHGTDGSGGSSGVACARCHETYPHPDDWASTHLTVAGKVGEAVCLRCHTGEYFGPPMGPSPMVATCGTRCHGGAQ